MIIGATIGSAVVLLVAVAIIVALGVYCCRNKTRSALVKSEDVAFSNISYGLCELAGV